MNATSAGNAQDTAKTGSPERSIPKPRAPKLGFSDVPRYWFAGSNAATQVANAVNLLFPAGERFFIRSVRHYLDRVSPERKAEVIGFFGQESRHADAHERLFDTLREQGYDIDSILERYEHIAYNYIEKASPPALRLAVTVALEHFTAILAEDALTTDELSHAHPEIRRLLEWHAVEELEHKAVAFDVLKEVNPSYALRITGIALATLTLGGFWLWAMHLLLKQEGTTLRQASRDLADLQKLGEEQRNLRSEKGKKALAPKSVATGVFMRGIIEYLRPSFHPMDRDHRDLIAKTLERLKEEGVVSDKPETTGAKAAKAAKAAA